MRDILHSDLNNFYASVECMKDPSIKEKAVVVCGSIKDRHGIVLAKNQIAKNLGVKTGQTLWEVRNLVGNVPLVEKEADFKLYKEISKQVKAIYANYTDRVESFGIDEAWIDVTHSGIFGKPMSIAKDISEKIKKNFNLTVSIGVSFNKVFAKLGSDMKKPDAITEIPYNNFKNIVYPLPVADLIYVGRQTEKKLNKIGVETIGDIEKAGKIVMKNILGKWGEYLYDFATGNDQSEVKSTYDKSIIKSVGNSTTIYRDLSKESEIVSVISILCDSICSRLKDYGIYKVRTIGLSLKDFNLQSYHKQIKLDFPGSNSFDFLLKAKELLKLIWNYTPIRSIGVWVTDFVENSEQLTFFDYINKQDKNYKLDNVVKSLKEKFGNNIIHRAVETIDEKISKFNPKEDNTIHPVCFFSP